LPTLLPTAVKITSSLGKFEDSLRSSLGGILSTDLVTVPARPLPELEGEHDSSVGSFDYWFVGCCWAPLVPGGIQPGSQRKTQNYRFAGTSGNQPREHETTQSSGHCFSGAFSTDTTGQHCSSPKVPFRKPAHCCLDRDFTFFPSGESQFISDGITKSKWNLEIQKTMFVELSEMGVRGS